MGLTTTGQQHFPGYPHKMSFTPQDELNTNPGIGTRYRWVLLTEGTGILHLNEHSFPILAPAIYCLNEQDRITLGLDSNVSAKAIYFHPELVHGKLQFDTVRQLLEEGDQDVWSLEPFLVRRDDYYGCIPVDPAVASHLNQIAMELSEVLAQQPDHHWPCRSRSYFMEILFVIRRMYDRMGAVPVSIPSASMEKLAPVMEYLHIHYASKIKVEELARRFHTNKSTLNHQFKLHTGSSIIAYLNTLRMQIASSMLRNTTLPIYEIMVRVGVQDDANFIRYFRKYSGFTPSEYRKRSSGAAG